MNGLKKITGLWKRTTRSERPYIGAKLSEQVVIPAGSTIMIFHNTPKEGSEPNPKAPQFDFMVVEPAAASEPRMNGHAADADMPF